MCEMMNLKRILKMYESIFSDILFGFEFVSIENNKIIFKDRSENKMIATVNNNVINFYYQILNYERQIVLELPNKDDGNDIKAKEIIKEVRTKGTIIEEIKRTYGLSNFSDKQRTLVDLISKRYIFDGNIQISDIDIYDQCLNNLSKMRTVFESHMKTLKKPYGSLRWYTDFPYSTITMINGEDISNIYDIVNGIDKIARIYDLYNGVINERNQDDIFSIHLGLLKKDCLGYKETSGINEKEDSICGKDLKKYINQNSEFIHQLIQNKIGYKKAFSCDNLNSLIEAITYQKTTREVAKESIEKELGIPYEEFDKLDCDEQHKLIQNYKKNNKIKRKKDILVMIGSGEHSTVVKVKKGEKIMLNDGTIIEAGLTEEESIKRLEDRMDDMLYSKPVSFVKKLTRRIKKTNNWK